MKNTPAIYNVRLVLEKIEDNGAITSIDSIVLWTGYTEKICRKIYQAFKDNL